MLMNREYKALRSEKERRRKNQREKRRLKVIRRMILVEIICIAVLLFVILFLRLKDADRDQSMAGKWSVDGVTEYVFDRDGKGALLLPYSRYAFKDTIDKESEKLIIDFESDALEDETFQYKITGDTLALTDSAAVYELKRVE